MNEPTQLSVLTLNCWGLTFMQNDRRSRMSAIGNHLASAESSYDIVGLQEVWAVEDFMFIRDLVQKSLPFAKHWTSGLFGSGLVVLSKYPIKSTSLRRYSLNGDPRQIFHGDWFDGKSCASAVILHPTAGEIEVFNTHMHATYDPIGTPDVYLGCRISQAWEMAGLIRTATSLGRQVIALGDFNSPPDSLVVDLLTRYAGLTDSWQSAHPYSLDPNPLPSGLTAEQGVALLGITCDTPLNSWTRHAAWENHLTHDPIGERLDYIFFNRSQGMSCLDVKVVLQEPVTGIGRQPAKKNMSDHFAVHATFSIVNGRRQLQNGVHHRRFSDMPAQMSGYDNGDNEEETVEMLEHIRVALEQHLIKVQKKSTWVLTLTTPLFLIATLGLILGLLWVYLDGDKKIWGNYFSSNQRPSSARNNAPVLISMVIGLSFFSSCWIVSMIYGFFHGGETVSAFVNVIQEVQTSLDYHKRSSVGTNYRATDGGVATGINTEI